MIGLVDADSFYASCEKAFNPALKKMGVVVLSNNDGCIVARSKEVKALGLIKMGDPFFKIRHIVKQHNIQAFSSNYTLYGDISRRVVEILTAFAPEMEVYSIDESFLRLEGFKHIDLESYCDHIRRTVKQWVGIPVSIGIAPTKTLSKVAVRVAKKLSNGVYFLPKDHDDILAALPISDIWGVGRQHTKSLNAHGITNALQLKNVSLAWAKSEYSVVMQRLVLELQGTPCFDLELCPPSKKSITVSRSFGEPMISLEHLREAIATYTSRAAEKLRAHGLTADAIQVFAVTNRFQKNYYGDSVTLTLAHSSDNTVDLLHYAIQGCDHVFQAGQHFKKAGVVLLGLRPKTQRQLSLWELDEKRSDALMATMDAVNARYGRGTLQFAVSGLTKPWAMKSGMRSPCYTTAWSDIPVVKI